ncbi:MAG: oligosaccharide flippase family protein [Candidatus Levybacteria bacterium]|nr:oligosaccharide flippase family protein [Candidatus Levybacteria bacterium]
MKRVIHFFRSDRTIKSTTLMVVGQAMANAGAYLFHLFTARLLVPADFGLLQSLISFSNILSTPLVAFNTVIAKFVSTYVGKGEAQKIASLYYKLRKYLFILLIFGGSLFFIFSRPIMDLLRLDNWLYVFILDLALFVGLINALNRATLRGLSLFLQLTIVQFIESYGKLFVVVIVILMGFGVVGAFGAFVFALVMSLLYMSYVLYKKIKLTSFHPLPLKAMGGYAIPSSIMTIGIISLYNTDVVLVRHFLSGHEAGIYGALSVLGKIIFIGTSRVTVTMFPLVSEAHAKGAHYQHIFIKSFLYLLTIIGIMIVIYAIAPAAVIRILIGANYLSAVPFLLPFSIFISLCAVINLLINFFLSINRTKTVYVVFFGAIIQAVGILAYHTSISSVITISLIVTAFITAILFLYYISIVTKKAVITSKLI